MPMQWEQGGDDKPDGASAWDEVRGEIVELFRDDERSVLAFDAEMLNVEWSGVLPGVRYGPGNLEADRVAGVLRETYRCLKHHCMADRVLPMTDLGGRPFVHVNLNADGVFELSELVRDGLRWRGEAVDEVSSPVRLDVSYCPSPGNVKADYAAEMVRVVYRSVTCRSVLDRVQAITDLDGIAFVYVVMNSAGALELADLVRDGWRLRGRFVTNAC